jgi:hypothetical protein
MSRVLVIEKTDHLQSLPRPRFAGDLSPSTPCPFLKPRWKSFTAGARRSHLGCRRSENRTGQGSEMNFEIELIAPREPEVIEKGDSP